MSAIDLTTWRISMVIADDTKLAPISSATVESPRGSTAWLAHRPPYFAPALFPVLATRSDGGTVLCVMSQVRIDAGQPRIIETRVHRRTLYEGGRIDQRDPLVPLRADDLRLPLKALVGWGTALAAWGHNAAGELECLWDWTERSGHRVLRIELADLLSRGRDAPTQEIGVDFPELFGEVRALADHFARTPRPAASGRPRLTDAVLRETADVYLAHPHAPRKAVAAHFVISDQTASDRIKKARDRGYLPPTTPGRKTTR